MSETQIIVQSSRVDEVRKAIFANFTLAEVQQLVYNLPPQPPTKDVTIRVQRDPQNPKGRILQIKQDWASLMASEQIAWTSPDARLEVRFSRAANPFFGDMFQVARGGKAFSGTPLKRSSQEQVFKYVLIVTTHDGYVLSQNVELKIAPAVGASKARSSKKK